MGLSAGRMVNGLVFWSWRHDGMVIAINIKDIARDFTMGFWIIPALVYGVFKAIFHGMGK